MSYVFAIVRTYAEIKAAPKYVMFRVEYVCCYFDMELIIWIGNLELELIHQVCTIVYMYFCPHLILYVYYETEN